MLRDFHKLKILIIEDLAEMRSSVKSIVGYLGNKNVTTAINGEEAIMQLRKKKYNLILSDYELGVGKDGQQVLEEVRANNLISAKSAYVMITAAQTVEMVMGALEYHPDGYITKPITLDNLRSRLLKILRHKEFFHGINGALDKKRYDLAVAEADKLLMQKPQLLRPIYRIKAKILYDIEQYDNALKLYQEILDNKPTPWAMLGKCKCLYHKQSHDTAEMLLKDMINENSKYVECFDLLAKIAEDKGDHKGAQKYLEAAIEESPKAILRQSELSRIATINKSWDTAIKASRRAVSLGNHSCYQFPHNNINLARGLQFQITSGGYRDKTYAITEIQRSLKKVRENNPLDHLVHIEAGFAEALTLYHTGHNKIAEYVLDICKKLFFQFAPKDDAKLIDDLIEAYVEITPEESASRTIQELIDAGILCEQSAQDVHILIEERKAKIIRTEVENINNKGVDLFERGRTTEAHELFQRAAEKSTATASIILNALQARVTLMQQKKKTDVTESEIKEGISYITRLEELDESNKGYKRYKKLQELFYDRVPQDRLEAIKVAAESKSDNNQEDQDQANSGEADNSAENE